ncbi:hypothetical protein K9857_07040 [Pseudomonas sp. REP124]|uniref:hypothetical protein n=1 Tax=Pseudomonas sp. REP124 TaxID=2875731 RepID=UPI001CCA013D|nr:hypothetical protein [Pseudomonas sp. REP124]MBZ9781310.1 hypothetical protein [Pseudomonas sp. REP124]
MSHNKERSFVATISTNHGNLHLPRLTYGKTMHIRKLDYDVWSFEANMNASTNLCVMGIAPPDQLKFYFYCIEDYYSIYLLTNGLYHRQALSNEDKDFIGAFKPDDGQTTYNLLDQQGRIITLDQFSNDKPQIRIQTRGGKTLSVRGKTRVGGLVCTESHRSEPLDFRLNIISRGAA